MMMMMYLMPGYWLLPHQSLGNTVMNYGLSNSESAQQLFQEIFLFLVYFSYLTTNYITQLKLS